MSSPGVPAITFDYSAWVGIYPEFSSVPQAQVINYFDLATQFCSNRLGPVQTTVELTRLLYLLTAHITALFGTQTDPNGLVGRINSATEGSVTVQTENEYPPGSAQWYQQTKYGAMYWAMTVKFRTMRYRVPFRPKLGSFGVPFPRWPGNLS